MSANNEPRPVAAFFTFLLLIFLIWFVWFMSHQPQGPAEQAQEAASQVRHLQSFAVVFCEMAVKDNLKVHGSGDFPFGVTASAGADGKHFTVSSYVDAQNSFGAKIRTPYICEAVTDGGESYDNWTLVSLKTY